MTEIMTGNMTRNMTESGSGNMTVDYFYLVYLNWVKKG
jgi:hypothetical protein